jgi:hypothetical protein
MLYADQKYDKTLEVMEALGIPTEDMPGATPTPAKPNTQNRGNVPKPDGGTNGGNAETPDGN